MIRFRNNVEYNREIEGIWRLIRGHVARDCERGLKTVLSRGEYEYLERVMGIKTGKDYIREEVEE